MSEFDRGIGFSNFFEYITSPHRKMTVLALSGVVLIGLVLRCLLLAQGAIVNEDGIYYIWRARTMMTGDLWNGVSAYWSPFYSFVTGLVGMPIGDFELGGRLVSLITGTLLIGLTFYLAVLLYDKTTALVGSLMVATHASLIQSSVWVMTESLYTLLFIGMMTSGWLALRDNNPRYWALTGLLLGLSYLTKPEALAFVALYLVFAAVIVVFKRASFRTISIGFLLMCFVASLCVVPYVVFIRAKVGEWTISQKISTNTPTALEADHHLRLNDDGTQTAMDRIWGDEYLTTTPVLSPPAPAVEEEAAGESPAWQTRLDWAYSLFRHQIDESLPDLISTVFMPFVILGLFASPWTRSEAARTLFIGAFLVATVVGYSFAVTNVRYLLPIVPLILIWTAFGLVVFGRWAAATTANITSGKVKLPAALIQNISVVALMAFATPATIARFGAQGAIETPMEEQRAGSWLKSQTIPGTTVVLAPHATVPYYADAKHVYLPDEDLATNLEYAKRRNASFIVFSSRRLTRNDSAFPSVTKEMGEDLQLVYSGQEDGNFKIQIYRVLRHDGER